MKSRLILFCFILGSQAATAQTSQAESLNSLAAEQPVLSEARGLLMLDYSKLALKQGESFDLIGVHYLHQVNDWLYFGGGINGPILEGNYGGFFTVDTTVHVKKRIIGNWHFDAGLALGGGGGGASIQNIKTLSGSGRYTKKYLGLAYEADGIQYGVNYSKVRLSNSPINDSALNFYVQKPISFSVGSFGDAGRTVTADRSGPPEYDSDISFEVNHLSQINPQGSYRGSIGLISPQFSKFISKDDYWFLAADVGYRGLDWYNQMHGGIGRRISLSPKVKLYGQLGIGTGGWVTDTVKTGPGLLVYPKVKAEYLLNKNLGVSVSAGHLMAPRGSFKNWTVGAAINLHLPAKNTEPSGMNVDDEMTLSGMRINMFDNALLNVSHNKRSINNINMLALQLDYSMSDHFYIPFQLGAATNAYAGYAGYTEMALGLGVQSRYSKADKLQGFAQLMYGLNDLGVNNDHAVGPLLSASIGVNYSLNERLAIYAKLGKTVSVNQYIKSNYDNQFRSSSVGLGITYRFSSPARIAR